MECASGDVRVMVMCSAVEMCEWSGDNVRVIKMCE